MTPALVYILGAIHMTTPMANMDACAAALQGLDAAARFRSHCIYARTGETIYARKRVVAREVPSSTVEQTPPSRLDKAADFERAI